jgi:hypothetical protein
MIFHVALPTQPGRVELVANALDHGRIHTPGPDRLPARIQSRRSCRNSVNALQSSCVAWFGACPLIIAT